MHAKECSTPGHSSNQLTGKQYLVREREKEREGERETETETERQRQRERETDRQTDM